MLGPDWEINHMLRINYVYRRGYATRFMWGGRSKSQHITHELPSCGFRHTQRVGPPCTVVFNIYYLDREASLFSSSLSASIRSLDHQLSVFAPDRPYSKMLRDIHEKNP